LIRSKNHGVLEVLTKIQFHHSISSQPLELDQYQNFENNIDSLASYHFNEIEFEHEYELEPQFCNSVLIFKIILTPVLNYILESVLIPMSDQIIELILTPEPLLILNQIPESVLVLNH